MLRASVIAALTFGACYAFAQTPAPRPEFEVASIKPNKSENRSSSVSPYPGGRFTARNAPLLRLIERAYRIKDFQISGAPAWLAEERYDIEAKAEGSPDFAATYSMLQPLFEDRLRLKFHQETREETVYALLVAKTGKRPEAGECGPGGEPRKRSLPFCGGIFTLPGRIADDSITVAQFITMAQFIEPLSSLTGRIVDKTGLTGKYGFDLRYKPEQPQFQAPPGGAAPGHIFGQKAVISLLVDALSLNTGRVVLDKTNLAGKYDIQLKYTPEMAQFQARPDAPPGLPPLPPIDPNGPSLFTAVQEPLGLKLESQKGPVEMIVIDQVERPSEN